MVQGFRPSPSPSFQPLRMFEHVVAATHKHLLIQPQPQPQPSQSRPLSRQHRTILQPPNTSISLRTNNVITNQGNEQGVLQQQISSLSSRLFAHYARSCPPGDPSSLMPPIRSPETTSSLPGFRWSCNYSVDASVSPETLISMRASRRVSARLERARIAQTLPPSASLFATNRDVGSSLRVLCRFGALVSLNRRGHGYACNPVTIYAVARHRGRAPRDRGHRKHVRNLARLPGIASFHHSTSLFCNSSVACEVKCAILLRHSGA